MNHEQFNKTVRNICSQLIIDGCKRSKICRVTLGQHNQPMFEGFINKDKNFGISVLNRIVDNFGYELMVVPIKKDNQNNEYKKAIEQIDKEFVDDFTEKLKEFVENDQLYNSVRPNQQINVAVNDIIDNIIGGNNERNDESNGKDNND